MFKLMSFKSDAAFWPFSERSDFETGRGAPGTLLGKATALVQRMWSDHAARQAMYELECLDDRTLKDIGIARDEIWHGGTMAGVRSSDGALDLARWS